MNLVLYLWLLCEPVTELKKDITTYTKNLETIVIISTHPSENRERHCVVLLWERNWARKSRQNIYRYYVWELKKASARWPWAGEADAKTMALTHIPACSVLTVQVPCTVSCDKCDIWNVSPFDVGSVSFRRRTPCCSTCITAKETYCHLTLCYINNTSHVNVWPDYEGRVQI